jgi:CheY-specific phosphatase CheX
MTPAFELIEKCLVAGATALFDACNRSADYQGPCAGPAPDPRGATAGVFLATIGFAADELRGNVVVVGSRETVDTITPSDFTADTDGARAEVMSEFANMLVGRLKHRLRRHGLTLMAGTPTNAIVRGAEIQPSSSGEFAWYAFAVERGVVYVRLEASLADGFELRAEQASASAELECGIVLF